MREYSCTELSDFIASDRNACGICGFGLEYDGYCFGCESYHDEADEGMEDDDA